MSGTAGRRMLAFVLCILIAPLLATPLQARAQPAGELEITAQSYESNFPAGLTMHVSADSGDPVDQAAIRFRIGTNPTFFETTTRFEPTTTIDLDLEIPFQLLGLPAGVEIEYRWRFMTVEEEILESEPQQAEWFDSRYDWQTFETEDVIVFAYGRDEDLYQSTAQVAQETSDKFQTMLQAPERPEPIRIWLYESGNDLRGALSPNSREWIGGASYAAFSLITGVAPEGGEGTMLRVIPHEVIHQILDDATANPFAFLPAWFDEGLAGWGQPVGTESMDELVQIALEEDRLPTVRSMIGEWGSDSDSARISYAASYSVVSFIVNTMGEDAILRMTEAYRAGMSHDEVLDTALGMTVDELDQAWRDSLVS